VSVSPPDLGAAGLAVGVLFGLFGVGGSAFATPVLALLGVPALAAVASPLPATLPASLAGAWVYIRGRKIDWPVVWRSIVGGVPAAVAGALASRVVGGKALLVLSGIALKAVGVRLLRPGHVHAPGEDAAHDRRPWLIIVYAAGVGLFTGLLANGGGFLLVPLFVLVLGLSMQRAAGTSLVVVAALSVPTLITHWALGHIDWTVAVAFAAGAIPGAMIGSRLAQRVTSAALRAAFAWLLIGFAAYFLARQLPGL
jgi:uncharacterized protein